MASYEDAGDLGLGRGLKPGAISSFDLGLGTFPDPAVGLHDRHRQPDAVSYCLHRCHSCMRLLQLTEKPKLPNRLLHNFCGHEAKRSDADGIAAEVTGSGRPEADVSEGKVCRIHGKPPSSAIKDVHCSCGSSRTNEVVHDLWKRLQFAEQEVEQMKQELELCQIQLDAKYRAIKILQQQLTIANNAQKISSNKSKNLNSKLIQELSKIQFELQSRESTLLESEEKWSAKFDSVCQTNLRLTSAMEEQTLKQRRLHAEKMALTRERDELLAFLRIEDREELDSIRSLNDTYATFTSSELAVLGACRCRKESFDPCSCAVSAAHLKKEIAQATGELAKLKDEHQDALILSDSYRIAFDEQLANNRRIVKRLSESCFKTDIDGQTNNKNKSPLKWLNSCIRIDDKNLTSKSFCAPPPREEDVSFSSSDSVCKMDELINLLEERQEMVLDKSEAVAHQRFAARLLARRVQQLEDKLLRTESRKSDS